MPAAWSNDLSNDLLGLAGRMLPACDFFHAAA
jgi:hypothetical protein